MFTNLFKKKNAAFAESGDLHDQDLNGKKPLIHLHKVVKTFKTASGDVTVLKGVDAGFYEGEFVGVIGKSGSGKSTLINMITGIDRPTSGEVFVGGTPVHTLNENQMSIWRGRNLGIVFQFFQLLPTLSLVENIMLPMDFCNMYHTGERRARAMELLRLVEMEDHADKLPSAISGGQQQRVAIARALANDPPILIADEPTGNLDSRTAESVFDMFEDLIKRGKTIVMVTHDSSLAKRVNRTVLIADGELVNEWVARALPTLSHQLMLDATHALTHETFQPGQVMIEEGQEASDHMYIITKGHVEVALLRPRQADIVVATLGPGKYFGEIEAYRGNKAIATVRCAPHEPVEVVAIDRTTLMCLFDQSEATRLAMESAVAKHEQENVSAREQQK